MKILNTNLAEVNISNDESIKETFKDFITESETNSLTIESIKDVFNGDDIEEVVLQKGTGTTFDDAISMIKDASIGFNPLTAKRIVVMLNVRNEKISTLLRIMEKFENQLKYAEKFQWGHRFFCRDFFTFGSFEKSKEGNNRFSSISVTY